jgi:hypothetical protein
MVIDWPDSTLAWALTTDGLHWIEASAAQIVSEGEIMPDPPLDRLLKLALAKTMPPALVLYHLMNKVSVLCRRAPTAKRGRRAVKAKSQNT